MLRLIFVLAIAFIGSQFPSYYFAYYLQTGDDARMLERSGGSPTMIMSLRRQEQALSNTDPVEMPLVFAETFDADRAAATFDFWEPRMPERAEEWAYGGVGLVLGFLLSGILAALFGPGRRHAPTVQQPSGGAAGRSSGGTARQSSGGTARQSSGRAAAQPWASKGAAAKPRPARSGSRIPVSTGNLREASRMAKEALRQAKQVASSGSDPAVADDKPTPLDRRVPMAVQRAATSGAVIPSRFRPPAITRRFESRYPGPVERMRLLRD